MALRNDLIALTSAPLNRKAAQSLNYVLDRRTFVKSYAGFDAFIDRAVSDDPKTFNGLCHHLTVLRTEVQRRLVTHEVYVGVDVVDRILFDALYDDACADPCRRVIEVILTSGLHHPGFVLYPLHSFGILGEGWLRFFQPRSTTHLSIKQAGVAVSAQTNSVDGTVDFLRTALKELGIAGRIVRDDIKHNATNPVVKWLTRNPLMVVRITSITGAYYENQRYYMLKLRLGTALLMLLSLLAKKPRSDSRLIAGSSRRINNWQTLDIKHYLTFERIPNQPRNFQVQRVPMNVQPLDLAQLSDLNVDIDPRAWDGRRHTGLLKLAVKTMRKVESGHRNHVLLRPKIGTQGQIFRKVVLSLDYFRRAFSAASRPSEAVVSMAVAFETLLMDFFIRGANGQTIVERAQRCMRRSKATARSGQIVADLFDARNAIVHTGATEADIDLRRAGRAYARCLAFVVARTARAKNGSRTPMADIVGTPRGRKKPKPITNRTNSR